MGRRLAATPLTTEAKAVCQPTEAKAVGDDQISPNDTAAEHLQRLLPRQIWLTRK